MALARACVFWLLACAAAEEKKPKPCNSFTCSEEGNVPVPKRPWKVTGTYCSMMGGGVTMLGGKPKKHALDKCCIAHGACVNTCGMLLKQCHLNYQGCMNATCAAKESPTKTDGGKAFQKCESEKATQEMLMELGEGTTCKEHKFSQRRACECVAADRAAERRALILRDVYRKYDSERVDVGAALALKANTPKLFAGVLTRLLEKFPAIIRLPNLDAAQAQAQNRLDNDNLDISSIERESKKREDADFDASDIFDTDPDL